MATTTSCQINTITLDVGGTSFKTTVQTLEKAPVIRDMILQMIDLSMTIFLDCDSEGFQHILEHLRFESYKVPRKYLYLCQALGLPETAVENYVSTDSPTGLIGPQGPIGPPGPMGLSAPSCLYGSQTKVSADVVPYKQTLEYALNKLELDLGTDKLVRKSFILIQRLFDDSRFTTVFETDAFAEAICYLRSKICTNCFNGIQFGNIVLELKDKDSAFSYCWVDSKDLTDFAISAQTRSNIYKIHKIAGRTNLCAFHNTYLSKFLAVIETHSSWPILKKLEFELGDE